MNLPFHLPEDKEFDVIGFGTNAVDYSISVPVYPDVGSKIELDSWQVTPGGEVASTMVGLQRLGATTAYVGRFGGDPAGRIGLDSLINEGVDCRSTEIVADARTQIAFILIDSTSGERTIAWQRDERLAYGIDEAPLDAATKGRILHLTPHDTEAAIAMAGSARAAGTIVSADIDNVFEGIERLLELVDVCICSEEFPAKLLGIADEHRALAEMHDRYSFPILGITLGSKGSLFLFDGKYIETPAFNSPTCVDTTGAGDAFRTGFLYGLLTDESLENCCLMANATAALKCLALGARAGSPTRSELTTMLKRYGHLEFK